MTLTSEQDVLSVGDDLTVDVQGDYLYGAPAAGNRLLSTFQVKRDRYALAQQWPGFIFGDVADDSRRSFGELPEAALDDKGYAQLEVPSSTAGTHSPDEVAGFRQSAGIGRPPGRPFDRTQCLARRPLIGTSRLR